MIGAPRYAVFHVTQTFARYKLASTGFLAQGVHAWETPTLLIARGGVK
jgi:hypothetical protein